MYDFLASCVHDHAVSVEYEVVVASNLIDENKWKRMPFDVCLQNPCSSARFIQFEGAGRKVDEQVGTGGRQLLDRIVNRGGFCVIGCRRLSPPGVFANVHAKSMTAKVNRRDHIGRTKITLFIEDIIIRQQRLLNCRLHTSAFQQAGSVRHPPARLIPTARMTNQHANIGRYRFCQCFDGPVTGRNKTLAK